MRTYDEGVRDLLVVLPTSLGKTFTAGEIYRSFQSRHPGKVLWVAHSDELLDQAEESFREANPDLTVSREQGGKVAVPEADVIIASIQTLKRSRLERFMVEHEITMLVVDEAHHAPANTYQALIECFRARQPQGLHLGVTATPDRQDKKKVADTYTTAYTMTLREAMELGWVPDVQLWTAETQTSLDDVSVRKGEYDKGQLGAAVNTLNRNATIVKTYKELTPDGHAVAFCAGVKHAIDMAEAFSREGIPAAALYGDMDKEERARVVADFRAGKIRVLTNYNCALEGFDAPLVDTVLLACPTKSKARLEQMLGRGLRAHPSIAKLLGGCETAQERIEMHAQGPKPALRVIDFVDTAKTMTRRSSRIAGVLDLPEQAQARGHSVRRSQKAYDLARLLSPAAKVARDLDQINLILRRGDLFRASRPSPLAKLTECAWRETPDGGYRLNMLSLRPKDKLPHWIEVRQDPSDRWEVVYRVGDGRSHRMHVKESLSDAIVVAERQAEKWGTNLNHLRESARWRSEPASPLQQALLKEFKSELGDWSPKTKGEAHQAISILQYEPDFQERTAGVRARFEARAKVEAMHAKTVSKTRRTRDGEDGPNSRQKWALRRYGLKDADMPRSEEAAKQILRELIIKHGRLNDAPKSEILR